MSTFEQPQFGEFGSEPPEAPGAPSRLSMMAIISLVTGIVALPVCCVPVAGSLFGIVPLLLGVISLVVIGRSAGALRGRGFAIGGLVLGLLSVIFSTIVYASFGFLFARMPTVYASAFDEDPAVVRTVLTSSASGSVSDEQIEAFHGAFVAEHGDTWSVPAGMLPVLKGMVSGGDPQGPMSEAITGAGLSPVPLPIELGGRQRFFIAVLDESETLGSGLPALADVGFPTADGGSMIWLVQQGSAVPDESPGALPADEGVDEPADPAEDPDD